MSPDAAPLVGLVLAGGQSRRMGRDKGSLRFEGVSQVDRAWQLLSVHCESVYVSVRSAQADMDAYRHLPRIVDDASTAGPAAGLTAAWSQLPGVALLVLAVDMPGVDRATLATLVSHRDSRLSATVYRHSGGQFEPLCAIWEPRLAGELTSAIRHNGSVSLRHVLEGAAVRALVPAEPERLASVNAPQPPARPD
jgi:molybdopterin-guanine dinucleotide biosynthesis protein A